MSKWKQLDIFQAFENKKQTILSSEDSAESSTNIESANLSAASINVTTEAIAASYMSMTTRFAKWLASGGIYHCSYPQQWLSFNL